MDIVQLNIDGARPTRPAPAEIRLQVALLASITTVIFGLIARFAVGAPLLPDILADFIFASLPISLVEFGVSLLGPFAKHLGFVGCVAIYLVALTALASAVLRYLRGRAMYAGLLSLIGWIISVIVVIPLLGGGLFGRNLRQGAVAASAWLLATYMVHGAAVFLLGRLRETGGGWRLGRLLFPRDGSAGGAGIDRRRALRWIGWAVIGVAVYDIGKALVLPWLRSGSGKVRGGDGVFPNIDGLAREVTPTEDFYEVSKNTSDPDVDVRRWKLEISGLVENPLSLSYDDIRRLPSIEQYATLECISNEVGGNLIGNALWRGVRLKDLLEKAVLRPGIVDVVLRASDGYADSIPLDRAMADGTILAYEMNGAPLNSTHGFPLRLIVPGIYGMKNVKWITRIEAVNYDFKGYWQARGWDDRAEYKTMSRIDVPTNLVREHSTIAGIAFAGDRGIGKVEVSTDGGNIWEQAEIKAALSPFTWVLWHKDWSPTTPGPHSLQVRATDGRGIVQTSERARPIPAGATGLDARTLNVE